MARLVILMPFSGWTGWGFASEPPAIDRAQPARFQTATFALGCFWCSEAQFGVMPGVIRTRVGYCGGTTENPTYKDIGDHAEAVQIDFDPAMIRYEELLRAFFELHNPCADPLSPQYRSAIFHHGEEQRRAALQALLAEQDRRGAKVRTEVAPLGAFTLAEDYHQKFYLQENKVLNEHFRSLFQEVADFIHSTAAARVNGYLDQQGTRAAFDREIELLGLPPQARQELERQVKHLK